MWCEGTCEGVKLLNHELGIYCHQSICSRVLPFWSTAVGGGVVLTTVEP